MKSRLADSGCAAQYQGGWPRRVGWGGLGGGGWEGRWRESVRTVKQLFVQRIEDANMFLVHKNTLNRNCEFGVPSWGGWAGGGAGSGVGCVAERKNAHGRPPHTCWPGRCAQVVMVCWGGLEVGYLFHAPFLPSKAQGLGVPMVEPVYLSKRPLARNILLCCRHSRAATVGDLSASMPGK